MFYIVELRSRNIPIGILPLSINPCDLSVNSEQVFFLIPLNVFS